MIRSSVRAAILLAALSSPAPAEDPAPGLDPIRAVLEDSTVLDGKVVYVDFWASWCAPCRTSFPWMQKMSAAHRDEGLEIVTIDVDRNPELGRRFAAALEIDLPIIEDPEGVLAKRFALEAMPTAFIFGRSGTLRLRHEGFRPADAETLETLLTELLAEPTPMSPPPSAAAAEPATSAEKSP